MKREVQWVVGWREWVALPDLDIEGIKAKLDTGAATSSLHAFDVYRFRRSGKRFVRFDIHPAQGSGSNTVTVEAEVVEDRSVRSSNGQVEVRPVINIDARISDRVWTIEMTLTNRDEMGFRMLLGRQALKGRFIVDPGKSFLAGRPARERA